MSERIPSIVIVGGGFGGLAAAKALRNTFARIVLIDRANHHCFSRCSLRGGTREDSGTCAPRSDGFDQVTASNHDRRKR